MIQRLPREYREKYARPMGIGGQVLLFAFRVIGPIALFFIVAIGLDVYSLFQ